LRLIWQESRFFRAEKLIIFAISSGFYFVFGKNIKYSIVISGRIKLLFSMQYLDF